MTTLAMTTLRRLRRTYLLFVAWRTGFRLPKSILVPVDGTQLPPELPPEQPQPQPIQPTVATDNFGAMYFREDLLDRLHDYFVDLRAMKQMDPDGYSLYRRLGGHIMTISQKKQMGRAERAIELDPIFVATLPTWGMTHLRLTKKQEKDEYEKDWITPCLIWYQRMKHHRCGVEFRRGVFYEVNFLYADYHGNEKHKDLRHITTYFVAIEKGNVKVLREQGWLHDRCYRRSDAWKQRIPSKSHQWSLPHEWWASQHKEQTHEEYLRRMFCVAAMIPSLAQAGIQVRATQGDMAGLFNINMLRTPYFFDDRIKEKGATGRTIPIFHIVRAHRREKKSGGSAVVHTHFRGLRNFMWNGYRVHISVPGLHHVPYQEFNVDGIDIKEERINEKTHTQAAMADWVIGEPAKMLTPYKALNSANMHLKHTVPKASREPRL